MACQLGACRGHLGAEAQQTCVGAVVHMCVDRRDIIDTAGLVLLLLCHTIGLALTLHDLPPLKVRNEIHTVGVGCVTCVHVGCGGGMAETGM